jgi:lipoate-protein ligase A
MFETIDLILRGEGCDGPMQMALDEVMLRSVSRPTLRIYQWSGPCVTFGYFQSLQAVRQSYPGIPLVRRWTGGGMVEHGSDLTFSLMIPRDEAAASMPPALFYRELHRRIAGWLSSFASSEVRLAGEDDIQSGPLCFTAPAGDDLLLSGHKILGGAQRRSAGALLYQGSIQNLQGLAGVSLESLDYLAMASALCGKAEERILTKGVLAEANLLAAKKYRSREWIERR